MYCKAPLRTDLHSIIAIALAAGGACLPSSAGAQAVPNLVSACSGVSLPRSAVTGIIAPIVNGIVAPTEGTVNGALGRLGGLPIIPALNIDTTSLLANAAAGDPITLQTLAANGTVVGPSDRCDLQADSFGLNTEGGIAIGGNRITGLGTNGRDASAGSADAIAFGNGAQTSAAAGGAIALGTNARALAANGVALGAGSVAARGALTNYAALGLAAPQTSAGELSVGAVGAARQITNVAAGSALTDAVNVGQLAGVDARVTTTATAVTNLTLSVQNGAIGPVRYANPATPTVPNGGTPTNDLTLVGATPTPVGLHNVRAGTIAAGSTDAVNGGQLFTLGYDVDTLNGLAVKYDDATRARVTLGGAGAPAVKLGNVAAATLGAGSTEAVNGAQLAQLGAGTAAALGGGSSYDPATNRLATVLTYNGQQYASVQAAFDAVGTAASGGSRYFHANSALADSAAVGANSVAIGPAAVATAANSVAIGTGATAARGAASGYAAIGLATPQSSAGEVSVGTAGAARQITNVAAGSAATDAVNVAQLAGVAGQIATLGGNSVQYDGADKTKVTLGGAGGTTITNVRAGTLGATSTDAVNGAQLYATNVAVTNNTTAITDLSISVANGATGPVQYSSPGSPTTPNGGTRTNDVTLVGAAAGAVGLHNVGEGAIAAGSTDAVNGGQVYRLALGAVNAVSYDTDATGNRTNAVTLTGGDAGAPVAVRNVAAGTVAAGSTDAVNGGQLYATDQAVTAAQSTADGALALGRNSVQYDSASHTQVTFGGGDGAGGPVTLHNIAPGISPTDAVNVAQLGAGIDSAVTRSNAYTDSKLAAISYDLRKVGRRADAGTAGALAAAGLPQAYGPGKGMISMAMGAYGSQTALAVGMSKAFSDGHTVVKLGGTYDTRSRAGGSAGVGYQF